MAKIYILKNTSGICEFHKLKRFGKIIGQVKIEKVTYFLTKEFKQLLSLPVSPLVPSKHGKFYQCTDLPVALEQEDHYRSTWKKKQQQQH